MNKRKWIFSLAIIIIIAATLLIGNLLMHSNKVKKSKITTITTSSETTKKSKKEKSSTEEKTSAEEKTEAASENGSEKATEKSSENSSSKPGNETPDNAAPENQFSGNAASAENPTAAPNNSPGTTSGYSGGLSVKGTKLVDSNGNPVQLKGLSTHGIGWFPQYVNADLISQFKNDFGINVIRLAMYTAEGSGYCTDGNKDNLKQLISTGVDSATKNNMYAIIDWHILSDNNPNMHIDEAKQFFNEMSAKYAGNPNVIYEICNEPNGGTTWSDIKNYALEIIPIIRSNSPNSVIIVGTPTWSQEVDKAAADPITQYGNIMYSLHFYAATHKDDLRNRMVNAIGSGLPIFVTEFGICDASGNGGIDEAQANEWIRTMNTYGVSYVMWNISNKNETSAIINPSCSKSSGLSEADLSASGKWFLNMMNGKIDVNPVNIPQETTANNTPETNSQPQNNPETTVAPQSNSIKAEAKAELTNSWEADNHTYKQYNIIISNNTGSDCTSWTASIDLKKKFKISQSWCANFKVNGTSITITPLDYNGSIPAGQKLENIGIIVEE